MFNNIDEAAKAIVDFCEQDENKRSAILILSEQTSEEDVSTVVVVNGKSGMLKGSMATSLAKNADLRGLFMEGLSRSIARVIVSGVENKETESEHKSEEEK